MNVDIWSDVVCPWCYVGKRRFETALRAFEHRGAIDVTWHSFELDPHAPAERSGDIASHLARKYAMSLEQAHAANAQLAATGAKEGIDFRFDLARPGNTFDAHRLIHLAKKYGIQDAVKERLLHAYFTDGEPIGNHETLVRVTAEPGLDPSEAAAVLEGDGFAEEVRADEALAVELGIGAVPFFLVDQKFAVSGAQPSEKMAEVLDRAWARALRSA